jgi:hypothetical protein
MHRFLDPARPDDGSRKRRRPVLPSASCESVGTSTAPISGLDSPAYAYPYRRFDNALTSATARLGAIVDRYSFDVELFHLLLHAGLARRRHNIRL